MSRLRVKDFPQMSQWHRIAPVWVAICRARSPDVIKPLLHIGQIWSRIPVWILRCAWKLPSAANCFEHTAYQRARGYLGSNIVLDDGVTYLHIATVSRHCAFAYVPPGYASEQTVVCMCYMDRNMVFRPYAFAHEWSTGRHIWMSYCIDNRSVVFCPVASVLVFSSLLAVFSCSDFDSYYNDNRHETLRCDRFIINKCFAMRFTFFSASVSRPNHCRCQSLCWDRPGPICRCWSHCHARHNPYPTVPGRLAVDDPRLRIAFWSGRQHAGDRCSYCICLTADHRWCTPIWYIKHTAYSITVVRGQMSALEESLVYLDFGEMHYHLGWHHCEHRCIENRCQHRCLIQFQTYSTNFVHVIIVLHGCSSFDCQKNWTKAISSYILIHIWNNSYGQTLGICYFQFWSFCVHLFWHLIGSHLIEHPVIHLDLVI